MSATSNADQVATGEAAPAYTPTDCGTLPFDASLGTQLSTTQTDVPVQAGVSVTMPGSDDPRRQSAVLDSTVVLPPGMTVNPSIANGLEACTDAQFAQSDRTTAAGCPAASQIGTVTFVSPLFLQTFGAPSTTARERPATFNRLFVDVPIPGVHLKLVGNVTLNPSNGQVTTTFQNLPQLPFTTFNLTFQGGDRSVLVNPQTCGTNTASAGLTPYARLTDATPPTRDDDVLHDLVRRQRRACAAALRPWFTTTPTNAKSGGRTTFTLKFGRGDRDQRIGKVPFRLPRGLIGNLALNGLEQCSIATRRTAVRDRQQGRHATVRGGLRPGARDRARGRVPDRSRR